MAEELTKLKQLIKQYDVISFDVFDTLLLRNLLQPTDLFFFLEPMVEETLELDCFHDKRIKAEQDSRVGHENNETTLDEIYNQLEQTYQKSFTKIKKQELELEKRFLIANPFMVQIYQYAKELKKKIIVISDMYLPKTFIEDVLKNVGYQVDGVYVSSEHYQVKGNQSLFLEVEEKEAIKRESWLHIGDNLQSDVKAPEAMGIHAYHYQNVKTRSGYQNESQTKEESILKGIIQNHLFTKEYTDWEKYGIETVSPLYYGFTNWIFQLTKHKENIYFLARDGYIIKKIYERFLEQRNKKMNTYYLYCSRAAFQLPALAKGTKEEAIQILSRFNPTMNQKVKLKNICASVDLDIANYQKELAMFGLTEKTILGFNNKNRIQKFLSYIYEDIKEKLDQKAELVHDYLKQMDFDKYQEINIVDIGWAGSTQHSLNMLDESKNIFGYYFGTRKSMYEQIKYNSFGYMFDGEEPKDRYKLIDDNIMMFEFIFSAPHGTTKGFKKQKNHIEPILDDFNENNKMIATFQETALAMCEEYLKYYEELRFTSPDVILANYKKILLEKKYEHLKMFADVQEAVGSDGEKMPFIPTYTLDQINENKNEFYQTICNALWKNAFFIKDMDENEFYQKRAEIFSRKTKIKELFKNISVKKILKALRRPRTTLRKIKVLLRNDEK